MSARFVLLAALLASGASAAAASPSEQLYQQDGWRLAVRHDAFAGRTTCRLFSVDGRMTHQPGALGLRVGDGRDVLHAVYRLDGGALRRWSDRYPAFVAAQIPVDGPRVDDGFGGVAWLPDAEVKGVRTVEVEAGGETRVRRFRLRGFAPMLDAARRLGCPVD